MEGNRKITVSVIVALIIAVIGLGVAFAAFSATLTINGNATVQTSSWDIHFSETEKTSATTGLAPADPGVTITPTTVSGTASSVSNTLTRDTFSWTGTFKSPNDTLEYRFYIVNSGDYNATLSAPIVNSPVCKINNETQGTCPITYTVTKDGTSPFTGSDSLAAGASQLVVVKAVLNSNYGGDGSSLASTNIDVSMSTVTFTYTQNGAAQSQSGGSGSGSGAAASVEVLIPAHYDNIEQIPASWGTMSALETFRGTNATPVVYIKRQNNVISMCLNKNSTDYCFSESDLADFETRASTYCSQIGAVDYIDDYGCDIYVGAFCSIDEDDYIQVEIGHTLTDPSGEDTEEEPYSEKMIHIAAYPDNASSGCYIYENYSTTNNRYEVSGYDCSY